LVTNTTKRRGTAVPLPMSWILNHNSNGRLPVLSTRLAVLDFPSHRASLLIGQYNIVLLDNKSTCLNN